MSKFLYLHGFASAPSSTKAKFFRDKFRQRGIELAVPQLDGGDFRSMTITRQLGIIEEVAGGRPVTLMGSKPGRLRGGVICGEPCGS